MQLAPVRTVEPAALPLSVAELKSQSRVDFADDDTIVERYIAAATDLLERECGIAIINQTWKIEADEFCDKMRLSRGPASAITSVKYWDGDGVQQTADTALYGLYTDSLGPFIELKSSQSWPSIYDRNDALEILWVAGYGASSSAVPQGLRQAIALLASEMYEHRSDSAEGTWESLPFGVRAMAGPFRVMHL